MKSKLKESLVFAIKPILLASMIFFLLFFLNNRFTYAEIYAPPFYQYPTYYLKRVGKPSEICKRKKFKEMIEAIILQKYLDTELAQLRQMNFSIVFFNRRMKMVKTRQYGVFPYISANVKITSPKIAEVTVFYRDKKGKKRLAYTEIIDYTGRIPPLTHRINANATSKNGGSRVLSPLTLFDYL